MNEIAFSTFYWTNTIQGKYTKRNREDGYDKNMNDERAMIQNKWDNAYHCSYCPTNIPMARKTTWIYIHWTSIFCLLSWDNIYLLSVLPFNCSTQTHKNLQKNSVSVYYYFTLQFNRCLHTEVAANECLFQPIPTLSIETKFVDCTAYTHCAHAEIEQALSLS